jgi:hypothetical protein
VKTAAAAVVAVGVDTPAAETALAQVAASATNS